MKNVVNPNVVKVVLDARGYALYFSRAPIPYARDAFANGIRAHSDPVSPFTVTSASTRIARRFCTSSKRSSPR